MSSPILNTVYPADNDTGIPVGASIVLTFSKAVDPTTIKDYIVLYGSDFDQTSGPDSAMWIDQDTGNNPFFLRSPGFKGVVDIQSRVTYYDIATDADIDFSSTSEADDLAYSTGGAASRVYITPASGQLAADTEYRLEIVGDPAAAGVGVSCRTVYDVVPDLGNTSATGAVYVTGGWIGTVADTLNIEITTSGDISTAKYKYWLTSAGSASAVLGKLTNRRYRLLEDGLQIRFSGTGFIAGDVFTVSLHPAHRLAANTRVTFTTNDGSYTAAPDSPSTPATSSPPSSILPSAPGGSTSSTNLQIEEMTPDDGAYNVSKNTRTITILFSDTLDASTITDTSVRIYKSPVMGYWEGQTETQELQKRLTISGQTLTIEI